MNNKNKQTCICPKCKKETEIVKIGFTASGTQRYICDKCGKRYTIEPKKKRYSDSVKDQAIKMFNKGITIHKITKTLGCSKSSIYDWKSKGNI